MRTRLLALTAAVAPLAALAISAPASAAPGPNCGSYPPGNAYGIRGSHNGSLVRSIVVRRGGHVTIGARVYRNGENCSGRSVSLFVHGPGEFKNGVAAYHFSGSAQTDANGLAQITKTVSNSFRWYVAYSSDNNTGIASNRAADKLVQAG